MINKGEFVSKQLKRRKFLFKCIPNKWKCTLQLLNHYKICRLYEPFALFSSEKGGYKLCYNYTHKTTMWRSVKVHVTCA